MSYKKPMTVDELRGFCNFGRLNTTLDDVARQVEAGATLEIESSSFDDPGPLRTGRTEGTLEYSGQQAYHAGADLLEACKLGVEVLELALEQEEPHSGEAHQLQAHIDTMTAAIAQAEGK